MYGIIYMAVFAIVLDAFGITVTKHPIKVMVLLAMSAVGLYVGGLYK